MSDRALNLAAALVILSAVIAALAFGIGALLIVAVATYGTVDPHIAVGGLGLASVLSAAAALRWFRNPDGLRDRIQRLVLHKGGDA